MKILVLIALVAVLADVRPISAQRGRGRQQSSYGASRSQQGFGGGGPQQPGLGGRPQQQGFGGRPQQQGLGGGRPQQQGLGGRPQQGFGGGRPQQQVLRGGRPQQGNQSPQRGGGRAAEQNFAPANYGFQWEVNDPQNGNDFAHQEERDGESTRGEYRVLLPDGRIMRVLYTINGQDGYVADVQFEGEARPAQLQAPRTGFSSGQRQFQPVAPSPDYGRFG